MNARDAWLATLGQLQIQLKRSTYDTWLRHAELLGYEDGRFVVTVPHAYAKDWIERHLLPSLTRSLADMLRRDCEVQIIVWDPVDEQEESAPLLDYVHEPERAAALAALNPHYTFDNLVVGHANQYAVLLAKAIVDSPNGRYSPVLFYGNMGLGKTHLLQATARSLLERGDDAVYVTAEDFTTELVAAIRSKDTAAIREKYRSADAILVDDLQFVDGKASTQSEIVAIWDALRNRQKTIIFAADRLPADMPRLTPDARSRFQAGPIAMLEAPDLAMRRAILDAHSTRRQMVLPPEVRDLVAAQGNASPRDLESAIEQLHTYSQLTRQVITVQVARSILRMNNLATQAISPYGDDPTLQSVLEATARYYRLSIEELAGRSRTKVVAQARQLAMYLAREDTRASLQQIGDALGGRDHSTILHGCSKITDLIASDHVLAQDVANIRQSMREFSTIPRNVQPK